jgi:hypothetical protein
VVGAVLDVDLGSEHKSLCAHARLPPQSCLQPVEPLPSVIALSGSRMGQSAGGTLHTLFTTSAVTSSCRTLVSRCPSTEASSLSCVNTSSALGLVRLIHICTLPAVYIIKRTSQASGKTPCPVTGLRPHYPRFNNRSPRSTACIYSAPRLPNSPCHLV